MIKNIRIKVTLALLRYDMPYYKYNLLAALYCIGLRMSNPLYWQQCVVIFYFFQVKLPSIFTVNCEVSQVYKCLDFESIVHSYTITPSETTLKIFISKSIVFSPLCVTGDFSITSNRQQYICFCLFPRISSFKPTSFGITTGK